MKDRGLKARPGRILRPLEVTHRSTISQKKSPPKNPSVKRLPTPVTSPAFMRRNAYRQGCISTRHFGLGSANWISRFCPMASPSAGFSILEIMSGPLLARARNIDGRGSLLLAKPLGSVR